MKKNIKNIVNNVNDKFGANAVMQLGKKLPKVDSISTGIMTLDEILGCGGIPKGRISEIYGPESSGKTTLALAIVASTQKAGGVAAYIDAEHALNLEWAKQIGVRTKDLLLCQPNCGEQALGVAETLAEKGGADIIIIDSVAALTPKIELEGDMGDRHIGLQARLMSQGMRKMAALIHTSNTIIIFINQIRMKIGVMFGNPETTCGGRALRFYASVRIDLRKIMTIKDNSGPIGSRVRARIVKNKVAPPFKDTEFDIVFDKGVDRTGNLLDMCVSRGIIDKSGAWYNYCGGRLGQGRIKAIEFMENSPEIVAELILKLEKGNETAKICR